MEFSIDHCLNVSGEGALPQNMAYSLKSDEHIVHTLIQSSLSSAGGCP